MQIFNIEIKNGYKKKYGYDRNKFSTIQTEEDAYWLGFFTADGCIVGKIYVGINLAARDIDHLNPKLMDIEAWYLKWLKMELILL